MAARKPCAVSDAPALWRAPIDEVGEGRIRSAQDALHQAQIGDDGLESIAHAVADTMQAHPLDAALRQRLVIEDEQEHRHDVVKALRRQLESVEGRTRLEVVQCSMLPQDRHDDPLQLRPPPHLLLRRILKPCDERAIHVEPHLVLVRMPLLLDRSRRLARILRRPRRLATTKLRLRPLH